ncbi:MAG: alpha/beta fold hydrolase [Alphaproteobacteria bacterium]|nr:alpha/beta fold hydrolase [Alphaproteobacteria bacterium]
MRDDHTAREDTAVVLIHGYLAFWPRASWARFAPLRRWLEAQRCAVHTIWQPPTGDLEARGRAVAARLGELRGQRLILVGHSMGGLAARLVAAEYDPDRRITDVVTLGAPHHGTVVAEWLASGACPEGWITRRLDLGGLRSLRPDEMAAFNAVTPDRPDVRYRAIAGTRPPRSLRRRWWRIAQMLQRHEGDNDGFVSVRSASWGPDPMRVGADHLGLIGLKPLPGDFPNPRVPRHFVRLRELLRRALAHRDDEAAGTATARAAVAPRSGPAPR